MKDEDAACARAPEIAGAPRDIDLLLEEIEREAVPESLLALARELQEALNARRQPHDTTAAGASRRLAGMS